MFGCTYHDAGQEHTSRASYITPIFLFFCLAAWLFAGLVQTYGALPIASMDTLEREFADAKQDAAELVAATITPMPENAKDGGSPSDASRGGGKTSPRTGVPTATADSSRNGAFTTRLSPSLDADSASDSSTLRSPTPGDSSDATSRSMPAQNTDSTRSTTGGTNEAETPKNNPQGSAATPFFTPHEGLHATTSAHTPVTPMPTLAQSFNTQDAINSASEIGRLGARMKAAKVRELRLEVRAHNHTRMYRVFRHPKEDMLQTALLHLPCGEHGEAVHPPRLALSSLPA